MVVVESLIRRESGENVKYNYFYRMLKDKTVLTYNKEAIEVQSYGIEIERQDIIDNSIANIERQYIKNISPQRHKVHNLLKMLYDNSVSPIHLVDILGEYVDEYIVDFDRVLQEIATN